MCYYGATTEHFLAKMLSFRPIVAHMLDRVGSLDNFKAHFHASSTHKKNSRVHIVLVLRAQPVNMLFDQYGLTCVVCALPSPLAQFFPAMN